MVEKLDRAAIMRMIAEERDVYEQYVEVCAHYSIKIDQTIQTLHQNRVSILEKLLGMMLV